MKLLNKAVFAVFAGLTLSAAQVQAAPAGKAKNVILKNVILMISDGAGINTWRAASYYRHGALGKEVYDTFKVQLFASTHPLNTSKQPTFSNRNAVSFDSAKLWENSRSEAAFKGERPFIRRISRVTAMPKTTLPTVRPQPPRWPRA